MKIGILGGSFNPIHDGHIKIANLAIAKLGLSQLWMIPTSLNPLKGTKLPDYKKRAEEITQITAGNYKIKVKEYEKCSLSTYTMLKNIKSQNKGQKITFIIGADNLENFHKWNNFHKLVKEFDIVIFSRNDNFSKLKLSKSYKLIEKYQNIDKKTTKTTIFRIKNIDISSTKIRNS
jgi:nicotinate-nucleotide adenylyltransferase